MASLIIRKHGKYSIVYTDRNGTRRWKATPYDERDKALDFMQSFVLQFERHKRKLSRFMEQFLIYARTNLQAGTVNIYRKTFSSFIKIIGDKHLELISPLDIETYKIRRVEAVSKVTVNIEFRSLKAAFQRARDWGLIGSNPFESCSPFRIPPVEPSHLSHLQFEQVLSICKSEAFRNLLVVAVMTMMRLGEIVDLTWSQVDFHSGLIRVVNKKNFIVKGTRPRCIPMNHIVRSLLRAMKKTSTGDAVFTSSLGDKWNPKSVSRRFKLLCRKAGLDERIHFHSLRHTGASWLAQAGVSLFTIQKILGHSSPIVTQIYSHLGDPHLLEAVEQLQLPNITKLSSPTQFSSN